MIHIKYNEDTDNWELFIGGMLIYCDASIFNVFARAGYPLEEDEI